MSYETLLVETVDGISTVRVNRPKALNAINGQVRVDLRIKTSVIGNYKKVLAGHGKTYGIYQAIQTDKGRSQVITQSGIVQA